MIDNLWGFYLFDERVVIPTLACTESAWMQVEPVRVAKLTDGPGVLSAIVAALRAGNPRRTFRADPKSLAARHAGAKSEREFENKAKGWSLERIGAQYRIIPYRRRRDGRGWEEDPSHSIELPPAITQAEIAERLLAILRSGEGARE